MQPNNYSKPTHSDTVLRNILHTILRQLVLHASVVFSLLSSAVTSVVVKNAHNHYTEGEGDC